MNWNLAISALIELSELGLRISSSPADITKYAELRRELLNEQVRIANLPLEEAKEELAPSPEDPDAASPASQPE